MLLYNLYRLYYLLIVRVDEVLPDVDFTMPSYHARFVEICRGFGYFLPLTAISQLFVILVAYESLRLALAFTKFLRNH